MSTRGSNSKAVEGQGTNVAGGAYARATGGRLAGPKLSLPLKLRELCFLC